MAKKINYSTMFGKRKDGRYQGTWKDSDGKHHTICDRDPERLYKRIQEKEAPPVITFRTIAEAWQDAAWPKLREGTISSYKPMLRRAIEEYGDTPADQLQAPDIYKHLLKLASQQMSAKSVKTLRLVYSLVYRNAIIDPVLGRTVRHNPAVSVPLPDGLKRAQQRTAPEKEVVDRIRKEARQHPFGVFVLFLVLTGFRRGEALAVQWRDVDFAAGTISCTKSVSHRTGSARVGQTKTAAGVRTVPLLPELRAVLERPVDALDTDYLFHGVDPSKPIPQSTYCRRWMDYCTAMGFVTDEPEIWKDSRGIVRVRHKRKPTLSAHVLRHGYATALFEAGVDVYTAQRLLGHANVEVTMGIYTHLRKEQEEKSVEKLIKFFA